METRTHKIVSASACVFLWYPLGPESARSRNPAGRRARRALIRTMMKNLLL